MTEKYARAGATENGSCSQNTESHLKPSTVKHDILTHVVVFLY